MHARSLHFVHRSVLLRLSAAGVLLVGATGCPRDALVFYEGAKLGFTAQYKPGDSQPVKAHLGFDRRVVAIVPPQYSTPETQTASATGAPETRKGEALAVVSTFEVKAHALAGVEVHNYFATGNAAIVMTTPQASPSVTTTTLPGHGLHAMHEMPLGLGSDKTGPTAGRVDALLNAPDGPAWPWWPN